MIEFRGRVGKRLLLTGLGVCVGFSLLGGTDATPASKVLTGKHAILYDIVNPTGVEFLPDYSNNSFSQKIIQQDEFSKRVLIEIDLSPLNSKAVFPIPQLSGSLRPFLAAEKDIPTGETGIAAQARSLVQESRTVHEAVTAIFNWIVDQRNYDASRGTPQDGRSVFYNRRGSCVGYSNLSIAMLRSVGIPARYAHGYLPPGYEWGISKKYWGVQISGGGYHGWIEVYYPDAGWCFSDLLHSKDFVDPFHVLRYIDGINLNPRNAQGGSLDVEEATTFTIFQEENATLAIDQLPLPKKDFLARQSGAQQFGTIHGVVKDPSGKPVPKGNLTLSQGMEGRSFSLENGVYSLTGLEEGTYRVTIRAEGYKDMQKTLKVKKGEVSRVDLTLDPRPPSSSVSPQPKTAPRTRP